MPLDPQAQSLVDAMAKLNLKPVEDSTPEEARESMRSRTAALGPFDEVAKVSEHRVPVKGGDITVRLYKPAAAGPHPALVFYHGGGWVIGDLYTHDGICRSLTNAAGCAVASVDYRLAPESKYPVAAEDSYTALEWIAANAGRLDIDARRVAVGGDSAGGNLSTAVALMARDRKGPALVYQALIYPVTNCSLDTPSYHENATGYVLTREAMRWFWRHYLEREEQGKEPLASPLLAPSLAGLPPALVITAATSSKGPRPAVRERMDSRASSGVESSIGLRLSLAIASTRLCACGSSGMVSLLEESFTLTPPDTGA